MDAGNLRPPRRAHPTETVTRNFNWIWYVGAAVWFLDAAISMHRGDLRSGLGEAGISALFLAVGVLLGKLQRRGPGQRG
ncbi:MAG TPA: hypothetical protein VME68_00630 [Acidobacteriaceae bacterium]|nr:hypothetical protein [Acidobacteriaceae bacterium]